MIGSTGILCAVVAALTAAALPAVTGGSARGAENGRNASDLPANEWVKLEEGGLGERSGMTLVYVPAIGRFLTAMGAQARFDRKPTPSYSEMTFDLGKRQWENALPDEGRDWGGATGPVEAPTFGYGSGLRRSGDGAPLRPDLRGGSGLVVHHLYAYDRDRKKMLYGTDMEYDPVARTWSLLATKANPGTPDLPPFEFKEGTREGPAWSQMCYDPINREFLLFGGTKTVTETGAPGTWVYSPAKNEWRKLAFGSEKMNGLAGKASGFRRQAHAMLTACRNRYYLAERPENAGRKLSEALPAILKPEEVEALAGGIQAALGGAKGYERTQLERAGPELAAALAGYRKLLAEADAGMSAGKIALAAGAEKSLRGAATSLSSEPPPRCYSPMVYDPESKRIVLFGGSALTHALADTWLYDPATRSWEERRPEISPAPRLSHGLVFLPKSRKVVLVGGWRGRPGTGCTGFIGEALPPQAWSYDVAANRWSLLRQWGKELNARGAAFPPPGSFLQVFAVNENDVLVTLAAGGKTPATWACRLDATGQPAAGAAEVGVKPGAEDYPGEYCSPEWYDTKAPPPDPGAVEAELKALPANRWVRRPAGGVLRPTNAYCTIAFDSDRDEILTFVGGHGTWHGADVARYSLSADRWHTDHYAQIPLTFGYFATEGSYGYGFRPWMGVHTWGGYAYDPAIRRLVILTGMHTFAFTYDSGAGRFDRPWIKGAAGGWNTKACGTPQGLCVWSRAKGKPPTLYRLDGATKSWVQLEVKGAKLPAPTIDRSGLTYDSKRHRLLLMPEDDKGDIFAYDLKGGELSRLEAGGKEHAPGNYRDCRYSPTLDVVFEMMGSAYDVGKNAWVKLPVDAAELTKGFKGSPRAADNTQGLVYDPKRDLFWAVNGYGNKGVFVLRLGAAGNGGTRP